MAQDINQSFGGLLRGPRISPRLGFEIWEILTILTVVLSLVSALMWYSNFQPQRVESDIIYIEKQKHNIYAHIPTLAKLTDEDLKFVTEYELNQKCYADISKITISSERLDQNLSKLREIDQEVLNNEANPTNNFFSTGYSELSSLEIIFKSYIKELTDTQTMEYKFYTSVLKIQNKFSLLCRATFDEVPQYLESINSETINLETFGMSQFESWKKNTLNLIKNLTTEFENTKSINEKSIFELKQSFNQIFLLDYKGLGSKNITKDKERYLNESILNLEKFEKKIVEYNPQLDSKVIYIFD